jgi:hypothetical protein
VLLNQENSGHWTSGQRLHSGYTCLKLPHVLLGGGSSDQSRTGALAACLNPLGDEVQTRMGSRGSTVLD